MSMSLPGAPGISMLRRSGLRDAGASRVQEPATLQPAVPRNRGRLDELAAALSAIQAATGLAAPDVAARLVEPLDPASPLRLVDVFADGRADLVTAYLNGDLDLPALLEAWQPTGDGAASQATGA